MNTQQQQTANIEEESLSQYSTEIMCPSFPQIKVPNKLLKELYKDEELTAMVVDCEAMRKQIATLCKKVTKTQQEIWNKIDSKMTKIRMQEELDKIEEENQQLQERIRQNNERKHHMSPEHFAKGRQPPYMRTYMESISQKKQAKEAREQFVPVVKQTKEMRTIYGAEYWITSDNHVFGLDREYVGEYNCDFNTITFQEEEEDSEEEDEDEYDEDSDDENDGCFYLPEI